MAAREDLSLTEAGKHKMFYGYIIVVASFFILALAWGTYFTFGIFFKPVSAEFGWTRAVTSGAIATAEVVMGSLAIVMGRLTDRFGPRVVVAVACGFFLGLGYLLLSRISQVGHLYLFYGAIIGIGMSASFVPFLSTVARWFVKKRGLVTGIILAGTGSGLLVIPILASWLIASYGWRTAYSILGIMVLLVIVSLAQLLRRDPARMGQLPYGGGEVEPGSSHLKAPEFSLRQAMGTRQLWMICAMYFGFGFTADAVMVHLAPHVTDLGISATSAASILGAVGGASIAGRVVMGAAADRIGNRTAIVISFVLLTAALLWLQLAGEVWRLYLFAIVYGYAFGALFVLFSPLAAELFGLGSHGSILGVIVFVQNIGAALGAVLTGRIFDITGGYNLAFLIGAVLSTISIILAVFLGPPGSRASVSVKPAV